MADTVAELMVKIGGDASGLDSALKGVQSSVQGVASGMKSIGVGLTAAVTVPLVAIGAAAMKASADIGGAYRSIQRETGATGTELTGLKTAFDTVFKTVPASATDVATAISRITQTLDLTTKATGELATQFLNLSRMTGTDITTNINSASSAFNAWGDAIPDAGFALDAFYIISQKTGQSVSDITDTLARAAGPAQAAGLGYQETAILIAQLGAAGVPTKQVISSLNAIIKDSTTNNRSAAVEWQSLVDKFKNPAYKATADDMKILGNNTTAFAAAAKRGDMDFAPLLAKIKESPDAINAMADKTGTLSEALTLLKNRGELALKPLGDSIYGVAKDIVKSVDPIMTVVENLGKAFDKLPEPAKKAAVVIGAIGASMGPVITMGASVAQIVGTVGPAFIAATAGMAPMLIPLAAIGVALGALAIGLGIAYTASATFRGVLGTLTTAFTTFGGSVMKAITQLTGGDFSGALDTIRTALNQLVVDLSTINWSSIGEKIRTEIAKAFSDKSSTLNVISDQIHKMIDAVPWGQLGQELGQAMGEMLSIGFGALTGASSGDTANPIAEGMKNYATTTSAAGGSSSGSGGFSGLKEAGKTAAGQFIAGFEQGLKDGMANINWAAVVAALWAGLAAVGPQIFGKDKNIFDYMAAGGAGDNSGAMREWILKQLPSWETIRDAIGKWWDDLVKQVGTWWDNIPWGNLFGGGGGKSTGKGAAMIDLQSILGNINLSSAGEWVRKNIVDPIHTALNNLWSTITGVSPPSLDTIIGAITGAADWVNRNIITPIKAALSTLWSTVTGAAPPSLDTILGVITGAADWVNRNIIQPIKTALAGLWSTVTGTAPPSLDTILGVITGAATWVQNQIIQPITTALAGIWSAITAPALPDISTFLGSGASLISGAAAWVGTNIVEPLKTAIGGIWDTITGKSAPADTGTAGPEVKVKVTADTTAVQNAINQLTGKDVIVNVWDNNTAQNVVSVVNSIQGKDIIINVWDNNTASNVVSVVNSIQGKDVIINVWDNGTSASVQGTINAIAGRDVIINVWDNGTCASVQGTINAIQGKTVIITVNAQDNASGVVNSIQGKTVYVDIVERKTAAAAEGMVVGMASGGHITGGPQMALIGEAGPEAVIPQKYWGGVAPWVLNSLPKYAGGVTTGGGGGGDNIWDKSLKQTADYAVNLKPINDTAARSLNYAIVTTQNTGVANQHLNDITAVGQATTAACNTTADACAATTAACSDNCTTATDGNTAAIAGSCSSMASSCAATAGSCAATAGSCAATAGSCGTTAGCLTNNCASYASGGYVDKPQFAFIGEREREYIIPESKMGSIGGGGTQGGSGGASGKHVHYHINIQDPILKEEITEERLITLLRRAEILRGGWL